MNCPSPGSRRNARRAVPRNGSLRIHGLRVWVPLAIPEATNRVRKPGGVKRSVQVTAEPPARERARGRDRPPAHPEFRAGRVMVLELRGEPDVRQRPGTGAAGASPGRPAGARPGRSGASGLAVPPALAVPPGLAVPVPGASEHPRRAREQWLSGGAASLAVTGSRCRGSPRIGGHMSEARRVRVAARPAAGPWRGRFLCPLSIKSTSGWVLTSLGGVR